MGARDLLQSLASAGCTVTAEGDRLAVRPASNLTEDLRVALHASKPVLLALLAGDTSMLGDESRRFLDCRARLLRWGWEVPEAEALAERLTRRGREADPRVTCAECQHYQPGQCVNHRAAGLWSAEAGHDLAGLLQRCAGFRPIRGPC